MGFFVMLREIIRPTQNSITLKLPDDYLNQEIEIIAFPVSEGKSITPSAPTNPYPLRGQPVIYRDPFGSVAEDEWQVES